MYATVTLWEYKLLCNGFARFSILSASDLVRNPMFYDVDAAIESYHLHGRSPASTSAKDQWTYEAQWTQVEDRNTKNK